MSFKKRASKSIALALVGIIVTPILNASYAMEINESNNKKVIIADQTNESKNVDVRLISKQSLSKKELPTKTSSKLDLKNINIYNDGTINTKLILHTNNKKKEQINLKGILLYDPNNENQILAKATINNKNYDVVHLSISAEGNKSTVSGRSYTHPTMNVYLKNKKTDDIEFYEIEVNNLILSKINKIKYNLEVASLEDAYWFVNVTEPMHEVTQEYIETISPRIARIRSVVGYSTLTWSYKNG